MAVGPAGGGSHGEDHRQAQGDCEVEVELSAEIVIAMNREIRRLSRHRPGEYGGPDVAQVKNGSADFGEADRRQVDLTGDPGELASGDFIDVEAWEAFHFAVP